MNNPPDSTLKTAVLEWQKKYGVQDGDPLLASLELFQIYFANWQARGQGPGPASSSSSSYEEFRDSFEALEHRTKALTKHATELLDALRAAPNLKEQLRSYHATSLAIVAASAFAAGVCISRLFLSTL